MFGRSWVRFLSGTQIFICLMLVSCRLIHLSSLYTISISSLVITIVVVKRSTALHPRSSKANQGRPKECKGCPCMYPGNCLRVMFSFLGGYQLSQSTMVSYAFLPHPSSSCKYERRERTMLNIQHSPRVKPGAS